MPFYIYACPKCPHTTEAFHKVAEAPKITCVPCGAPMAIKPVAANILMRNWDSTIKTSRMKEDQTRRGQRIARRQYERYGIREVVPNVTEKKTGKVQMFGNWDEAASFAEGQGYNGEEYRKKGAEQRKRRKTAENAIRRTTA